MISKNEAMSKLESEIKESHTVRFYEEHPEAYVFICKNKITDAIPDTIFAAVNKRSGKMGYSVYDIDAAIDCTM